MAKRSKMSEREFKTRWRELPEADRRFISTLALVNQAVDDGRLRYHELSPPMERNLRRADRNTLFSILTECLGILTNAPAMQRVRKVHQKRAARVNGTVPAARRGKRSRKSGRD